MFERILIFLLKKYQSKLPHDTLKFDKEIDDKIYFEIYYLIKFLEEKMEG